MTETIVAITLPLSIRYAFNPRCTVKQRPSHAACPLPFRGSPIDYRHMLDPADAEGIAVDLLTRAGYDPTDRPGARAIAARLHGFGCIERWPGLATRGPAWSCTVHGCVRIVLRGGLAPEHRNFAIAHELAELELRRLGYLDEDLEEASDAIGAALVAPRRAFAVVLREIGADYAALADAFVATESLVALRMGEVTGEPMVLVTPQRVRVRGATFEWGDEGDVRAAARRAGPGVRKVRLRDDPRRMVLRSGCV